MIESDGSRVGAMSPDIDGDTGDRMLTEHGDPSVTRSDAARTERGEKRTRREATESAEPSTVRDHLVDGGPTQAGGTADEPPTTSDPGGAPIDE
jgi:hypothetical protein